MRRFPSRPAGLADDETRLEQRGHLRRARDQEFVLPDHRPALEERAFHGCRRTIFGEHQRDRSEPAFVVPRNQFVDVGRADEREVVLERQPVRVGVVAATVGNFDARQQISLNCVAVEIVEFRVRGLEARVVPEDEGVLTLGFLEYLARGSSACGADRSANGAQKSLPASVAACAPDWPASAAKRSTSSRVGKRCSAL